MAGSYQSNPVTGAAMKKILFYLPLLLILAGWLTVQAEEVKSTGPTATLTVEDPALAGWDILTLKDGTIVKGTILEETDTTVKFKNEQGDITTYAMKDILKLKKGKKKSAKRNKKAAVTKTATPEATPVDTPVSTPVVAAKVPQMKMHLEVGGEISLTNTYSGGNQDAWFTYLSNLSGTPDEGTGDTAPGFDQIDLRLMFGDVGEPIRFGVGISGYIGSTHAFNYVSGAYGPGIYQFAATPDIAFMSIPFQIQLGSGSSTYLTLEPALGYGFLSDGYLDQGSLTTILDMTGSSALCYQFGAGFDTYLGGLMLFTRAGYRQLNIPVEFINAKGETRQYTVGGAGVELGMSGMYWTLGLGFSL